MQQEVYWAGEILVTFEEKYLFFPLLTHKVLLTFPITKCGNFCFTPVLYNIGWVSHESVQFYHYLPGS